VQPTAAADPAAKAHTYSAKKHRAEMTVWSVDEMRDILRFAVDRRTYSLYRTALNTGPRRGELLGHSNLQPSGYETGR
jgi:hypothetical protein